MTAFKKLEVYDGTEDVERFIDRFEFAVTVDGLDDKKEASYLAMHLRGAAYDMWKGMEAIHKHDVTKIKQALRDTYGVRRSAAWRAMTTYRIGSGQQLDSACEQLHKWAKIVTHGTNPASSLAAVAFVEALPTHIAQKVRVLCGQSATKEAVVVAAKDVWDDSEMEMVAAVSRSVDQRSLSARFSEERRRCHGCGMVGHLRRNCIAVCSKCGGRRHSESFCRKSGNGFGEQSSALSAPRT